MAVPNGSVIRFAVRWKGDHNQDIVHVWHAKASFTSSQSEEAVADGILDWLAGNYDVFQYSFPEEMSEYDLKVDVVDFVDEKWQTIANIYDGPWSTETGPTMTNESLPSQDAAVIKFLTGSGKHVGKKFFGPFGEEFQDKGSLTGAFVTTLETAAEQFLTDVVVAGLNVLKMGLASTTLGAFMPFVGYAVNTVVGHQNRRKQNVGS